MNYKELKSLLKDFDMRLSRYTEFFPLNLNDLKVLSSLRTKAEVLIETVERMKSWDVAKEVENEFEARYYLEEL